VSEYPTNEKQAEPLDVLEARIMDVTVPKTGAEWWARREIERLRAELAEARGEQEAMKLSLWRATQWGDQDDPSPDGGAIAAASPLTRTDPGRFEVYAEAQRLVSAKRSKAALVDLVNWLLVREAEARLNDERYRWLREQCGPDGNLTIAEAGGARCMRTAVLRRSAVTRWSANRGRHSRPRQSVSPIEKMARAIYRAHWSGHPPLRWGRVPAVNREHWLRLAKAAAEALAKVTA
jgi:hypothetical protein